MAPKASATWPHPSLHQHCEDYAFSPETEESATGSECSHPPGFFCFFVLLLLLLLLFFVVFCFKAHIKSFQSVERAVTNQAAMVMAFVGLASSDHKSVPSSASQACDVRMSRK